MKKRISLLVLTILGLTSAAFAERKEEVRQIGTITEVSVSTGINLTIAQGISQEIRIEADEEDITELIVEFKDGKLKLGYKNSMFKRNRRGKTNIYIQSADIKKIDASSGTKVTSNGQLKSKETSIDVSSGSNVNIDIESTKIECDASSGSSITLKGYCKKLEVDTSSGSTAKLTDLESKSAKAEASSGSSITLNVTKELEAKASSGASIRYIGNPSKTEVNKSSGGSISADK
ncbi:MAG: head GIN domain-containing protein [Bacteroidales bacterium]